MCDLQNSCCGCLRRLRRHAATVPSIRLSSAAARLAETSRVIDGFSLLREILSTRRCRTIPVCAFSTS